MVVVIKASAKRAGLEPTEPRLPGSKSHSQRAMLLAGLTPSTCLLRGALRSEDTAVLGAALEKLGATLSETGRGLEIEGAGEITSPGRLELGENGTALRSLGAILPMLGLKVVLDGKPGLRARPMAPLLGFLAQSGVPYQGDRLPLEIDGRGLSWDEPLEIDASLSSQVASGALIGMALRHARELGGSRKILVRSPVAPGYLELSAECLRSHGQAVTVDRKGEDMRCMLGERNAPPTEWAIPADASAWAFPLVLRAMGGWTQPPDILGGNHPDLAIRGDIDALTSAAPDAVVVLDQLGLRPDCFPALCALAATRSGPSLLAGAPALRGKESDRIAAMAAGLKGLGIEVEPRPDGLLIRGPLPQLRGEEPISLPAPADHRVVMALALLGTQLECGIRLNEDQAVTKSWPCYWEWLGENAEVTRH